MQCPKWSNVRKIKIKRTKREVKKKIMIKSERICFITIFGGIKINFVFVVYFV